MKRVSLNLVKAAAGGFAALVFLEIILALFWPQERQTPLFDSTEVFPLVLRKNLDGIHVSREFSVRYHTSTHRLRDPDRPLEKAPGVFRILVLGDSLTFGSGVNDEDTFVRQLERLLNARGDSRRYEVINAACASWGTAHHLVFLDHLGFRLTPDVVLMAFHDDDPKDNRISGFFTLDEAGNPVWEKPRDLALGSTRSLTDRIPLYAFLAQHSNLFSALRLRLALYIKNLKAKDTPDTNFLDRKERPAAVWPEADWKLTARLLQEFKSQCFRQGARPALMHAPFPRFNRAVETRFRDMARTLDIPALPLIDRLAGAPPGSLYYFPVNRHFTPEGHGLIARALERFLERNGLLRG